MIRTRPLRGFSMLGTVIAFALMAVLVTVSATATWKLAAPGSPDAPGTELGPVSDDAEALAGAPGRVLSAARGVVLNSHAQALVSELGALGFSGELSESDVGAALARFPVVVDGVTITASTAAFPADRIIRLSDGSATVCVEVPKGAAARVSAC